MWVHVHVDVHEGTLYWGFLPNNFPSVCSFYSLYGMFDNYNWPKYSERIGEHKIRPDLNYKNFKTAGLHVPTIRMAPVINFVT